MPTGGAKPGVLTSARDSSWAPANGHSYGAETLVSIWYSPHHQRLAVMLSCKVGTSSCSAARLLATCVLVGHDNHRAPVVPPVWKDRGLRLVALASTGAGEEFPG
jgi:hypothetical protein